MAEPFRIATWHVELTRKGPGLLLADIEKGDTQVQGVVAALVEVAPDVVLLTGIDWDYSGAALTALQGQLEDAGHAMPFFFAAQPNSGLRTDLDLNGNGYTGDAADAQGYGRFPGHGGMALMSTVEIGEVRDFSAELWTDQPDALLPVLDGAPFPSAEALKDQRLSSVAHWDAQIAGLRFLAFSATAPVFDGPEDRNGKRNHDEIMFWARYLDGVDMPAVVLGKANLDPLDGEGLQVAITSLLAHSKLQDPQPRSRGAAAASAVQGGVNSNHRGNPALDTADWGDEDGPGNLRVSYVLPDRSFEVLDAGVHWIEGDKAPSRHHMVWVDIDR